MSAAWLRLDSGDAAAAASVLTLGMVSVTALAGPLSSVSTDPAAARAGLGLAAGITVAGALLAWRQSGSAVPALVALGAGAAVAAAYTRRHAVAVAGDE